MSEINSNFKEISLTLCLSSIVVGDAAASMCDVESDGRHGDIWRTKYTETGRTRVSVQCFFCSRNHPYFYLTTNVNFLTNVIIFYNVIGTTMCQILMLFIDMY